MYKRRSRTSGGRRRRVMQGRGFMDMLKSAWSGAKRMGLISGAAGLAGQMLPGTAGKIAAALAPTLEQAGYGRRSRLGKGFHLAGGQARRRRILNY